MDTIFLKKVHVLFISPTYFVKGMYLCQIINEQANLPMNVMEKSHQKKRNVRSKSGIFLLCAESTPGINAMNFSFLRFLPIFGEKNVVFLQNQSYYPFLHIFCIA
jgi:hypothetical protein